MITLRVVIGLLMISYFCYSRTDKSSTKTAQEAERLFKSELGFELKIPECLLIVPSNDADDSDKDPKTVDISIINKGPKPCAVAQKKVLLSVWWSRNLEPAKSADQWVSDADKSAKLSKIEGGTNYLLTKRNFLPEIQYLTVSEWHNEYVQWQAFAICEKKIFILQVRRDIQDTENILNKIKKGDPSLPPVEKKMIESFRCVEK